MCFAGRTTGKLRLLARAGQAIRAGSEVEGKTIFRPLRWVDGVRRPPHTAVRGTLSKFVARALLLCFSALAARHAAV